MENQRNNKGVIALLIIIIVILAALCILLATGTISFKSNDVDTNKPNDNVTDNNITNENNDSNLQTSNYDAWMNYILEQNITNINIDRREDDYHAKINLTTTQLKGLFSKLMNYKLVKYYLQGSGFVYGDIITISYSVNNNNYSVEIGNGEIWADDVKDQGLLNALENSKDSVENEDDKDMPGAYFNYEFQGYESSILDEYFK